MPNNTKILIIISVVLIAILGMLALQTYNNDKTSETIGGNIDKIIDNAKEGSNELREEIEDEIDDHTTDKR